MEGKSPVRTRSLAAAAAILAGDSASAQCTPEWEAVGGGISGGVFGGPLVWFMTPFDEDGLGPAPAALFLGGYFENIGGQPIFTIARWSAGTWSQVGGGMSGGGSATDAVQFDEDGAGPLPPALFVAGDFTTVGGITVNRIARWNGQAWSALGAGLNGAAYSLAVFDADGPGPAPEALYVGGTFAMAGGGPAIGVARYAAGIWSSTGFLVGGSAIRDLALFDEDGPGLDPARLFAGGSFSTPVLGGMHYIARYNGGAWSGLANGMSAEVRALLPADIDGAGPGAEALLVGGAFLTAGTVTVNRLAAWSGTAWSSLDGGIGFNDSVRTLVMFDVDAAGPEPARLHAGGLFTTAGGAPAPTLARWNGTSWEGFGGGVSGVPAGSLPPPRVNAFCVFDDDGPGPRPPGLYVGGAFVNAGALLGANGVARWGCSAPSCYPDCNASSSLTIADFACFQNAFVNQEPYADCNNSGTFTIADFPCFQNAFVAGCP